ncbi:hypothetical protein L2E82_45114 [Cichorium intybus]|uniref:Uncharacterized protein n=1 Tax=Cichorium intybus TaxID=13427 RepID=A0ACB8ZR74_CICIN|nr:hypothetical protein L2E82_45114 [Cichorium intybus]
MSNRCGLQAMSPMRPSGYDLMRPVGYDSGAAFGLCLRCGLRAMTPVHGAACLARILLQEQIARACCMGRKWFQRGTIDHFLLKYSHAKCGVTGDEPRKERRNE